MISKIWAVVWKGLNDAFDYPIVFGLGWGFGVLCSILAHFML